jgi:V8-like Glu-specific endopeptidase
MKKQLFSGAITVLVALVLAHPGVERKLKEGFEELPLQGSGNGEEFLHPQNPEKLIHHYTVEEINRHRWISIDRNGIETVATDEEVLAIIEKVNTLSSNFSAISDQDQFENSFLVQNPSNMTVKKRTILGTDGRYKHSSVVNPYCAIGQLQNGCTAFLVGPYHAITAGHCVYDCSKKQWKTGRGLYLRRNCKSRGIFMDDVRTWLYPGNYDCDDDRYDIAWILLDKTDYISQCWTPYAFRNPMGTVPGEICGYPADKPEVTYPCLYCSRCGDIKQIGSISTRLQYTCDSYGGMSGGPVLTAEYNDKDYQYAYGVHTHSSRSVNKGTRLERFYFYWTKNWKCANGGYSCD